MILGFSLADFCAREERASFEKARKVKPAPDPAMGLRIEEKLDLYELRTLIPAP
jgi:hypothetical protein